MFVTFAKQDIKTQFILYFNSPWRKTRMMKFLLEFSNHRKRLP